MKYVDLSISPTHLAVINFCFNQDNHKQTIQYFHIVTGSVTLKSTFKSMNNKSQLYHTDIHVQVLIAFND